MPPPYLENRVLGYLEIKPYIIHLIPLVYILWY